MVIDVQTNHTTPAPIGHSAASNPQPSSPRAPTAPANPTGSMTSADDGVNDGGSTRIQAGHPRKVGRTEGRKEGRKPRSDRGGARGPRKRKGGDHARLEGGSGGGEAGKGAEAVEQPVGGDGEEGRDDWF